MASGLPISTFYDSTLASRDHYLTLCQRLTTFCVSSYIFCKPRCSSYTRSFIFCDPTCSSCVQSFPLLATTSAFCGPTLPLLATRSSFYELTSTFCGVTFSSYEPTSISCGPRWTFCQIPLTGGIQKAELHQKAARSDDGAAVIARSPQDDDGISRLVTTKGSNDKGVFYLGCLTVSSMR